MTIKKPDIVPKKTAIVRSMAVNSSMKSDFSLLSFELVTGFLSIRKNIQALTNHYIMSTIELLM